MTDTTQTDPIAHSEDVPSTPPTATAPPPTRAGRGGSLLSVVLACGLGIAVGAGGATLWYRNAANAPVAIVNGEPIPTPAFVRRLELAAGNNVFPALVDEKLQAQLAKRENVLPTDADIQAKYDEVSKQPGFLDSMKKVNQTPEDVKTNIRTNLTQQALVTKGITVSDADVRSFYDVNVDPRNPQARYYRAEAVRIAAIISPKPEDIKAALHALATGAPFAQIAATYSQDQSKANGGMLPPIKRGQLNSKQLPGLEAAIFALKPGQQIDSFKTGNMIWIVRCLEHIDELKAPFDKVKEECREGALLAKGAQANGKALQSKYEAFRKEAKIDILRPEYKDALAPKSQQ